MTGKDSSPRLPPDWLTIRRLYEEGRLSVRLIAEQYGVTTSALHRRRAAENWPLRSQARTPVVASMSKAAKAARTKQGRKAMVDRLYNILEQNLTLMEIRMESGDPGTAADRERDTRTIGSLTRAVEKITELDAETRSSPSPKAKSDGACTGIDEAEADRIRLELAQRILKFRARGQPR